MNLSNDLKQQALNLGAAFFGIADLSPAKEFIRQQGGDLAAAYPIAISIGVALQHSLVDPLPDHDNKVVIMNYRLLAYDAVNQRLDQISLHLSGMLQAAGFRARPVPASQTTDSDRLVGFVSNKLAASLAGLGWIGKSCLLITPETGPRVRWATVLTTAILEPTGQMMAPRCGDCQDCVNICPVQAFTGTLFNPAEPREVRFEARKCSDYLNWRETQNGYGVCGLCLYACPHGKSASRELQ